jgi:hypothetical protein
MVIWKLSTPVENAIKQSLGILENAMYAQNA